MTESTKRPDGRVVAEQQMLNTLAALARFGHLRTEELRHILWPASSAKDGRQMASRLLRRMATDGLVLGRTNLLGGQSYVLTAAGARVIKARTGLPARDGYDIQGVCGPQFWHRTLATSFLLQSFEYPVELDRLWGEYAIGKGMAPVGRGELRDRFLKLPDGLARIHGPQTSLAWIEVESSFKPEHELDKIFERVGGSINSAINHAETVRLGQLWIVYDATQGHERRLLAAARRAIRARVLRFPQDVVFFRCQVARPMQLLSFEAVELHELLAGGGR
jgi:hypothetical protein